MPLLQIELMEGHTKEVYKELIERCTTLYCDLVGAQMPRMRTQIRVVPKEQWGMEGVQGNDNVMPLLIFELMEGRSREVLERIMAEVSALVASILHIELSATRALLREFPASNWVIGGVPASVARASEVAEREAAKNS